MLAQRTVRTARQEGSVAAMRLWSLHPSYLDTKALVAAWREGLLARAVLRGETRGYRHHPQLDRFRAHPAPRSAINAYLRGLHEESLERGYRFDRSKIGPVRDRARIRVTAGQLRYELGHLRAKVRSRSPSEVHRIPGVRTLRPHPLFEVCPGAREPWERGPA